MAALDQQAKDRAAQKRKLIEQCGSALIGELAETMPEWQATKVTAAIERLIEAYTDIRS